MGLCQNFIFWVTTGLSLTAWIVSRNALRIQELVPQKKLLLAIVGAAGSIGTSCYHFLGDYFDKFILLDKNIKRLHNKINLSHKNIIYYGDNLDEIKRADIIITVTNAPYAIIKDDSQVSEHTIIIDDAQPLNASDKLNSQERNILVIEGGVCNLEGIRYKLDLGLLDQGDMFSCMGELITLAALDSREVTLGDTSKDKISYISNIASEIGIKEARFRSFGKLIDEQYIKNIFS